MAIKMDGLRALLRQQEEERREPQQQAAPTAGSEQLLLLPPEALTDHPCYAQGVPFQPASEERLAQLAESIRRNGILSPLLVRPLESGRWQTLAGHNRKRAAARVGLRALPCLVRDVPEDEATDIFISDNLLQRIEGLLPSEKAHAYKMKLAVLRKRQGQRTDLTSGPTGQKLASRSVNLLADDSPDSAKQIQRYIRLAELIPPLLELVDRRKLGLQVGVALSYLCQPSQRCVYDFLTASGKGLTRAVADELREMDADPSQEITAELLQELTQTPRQRAPRVVKLQMRPIRKYFPPDTPPDEIEATIAQALDYYFAPRGEQT